MIIIIYSKKIFQDNPVLDADRIYNHDESGFPTNQTNWKFITVKGERAFKLSFGARRENITSNGIALDPLIIFKGKNLMELWFGTNALPNTYYSKSDKRWMDSWRDLPNGWKKICKDVKEQPLLLIYDRHMTHVTIPVIILAVKENVILIKLPPHCTDLLQVLDKTYFHP